MHLFTDLRRGLTYWIVVAYLCLSVLTPTPVAGQSHSQAQTTESGATPTMDDAPPRSAEELPTDVPASDVANPHEEAPVDVDENETPTIEPGSTPTAHATQNSPKTAQSASNPVIADVPTLHLTVNGSDADREVPVGTALNIVFTGPWSAGNSTVGITTVYDCGPSQDGDGNLGVTVNDGSATYQGAMENCTYTFFGNMLVSGVLYKSNEITLTPVAPTLHLTVNGSDANQEVPVGTALNIVLTGPWSAGNPTVGITTVYDCGPSQDGDGNLGVTVNDGTATYQGAMENCTYTFFGNMLVSGVLYKSNEITLTPVAPTLHLTVNGSDADREVPIGTALNIVLTGPWSAGNPTVGITTIYDCGPSQDGDGNLGVTVSDGSATYQGAMENCTYTFFGNMLVSGVLYKSNEITLTPVTPAISLTANGKNDTVTVTTGDTVTVNAIGNWEQQELGLAYRLGLSDQSCALSTDSVALIPTGPGEAAFTWIPVTAGNYAVQAYWTLGDNAPLTSNCVFITVLTKTPGQTPSPSPSSTVSPCPTVSPTATSTTEPTASATSTATSSPTGTTEPTSSATATGTAAATATTSAVTGLPSTGDGPGSGSMWIGSATVVAVALIMAGSFVYRINRSRS